MAQIPDNIQYARNLIKEVAETKAKTLDLGYCGLTDLEKEVPDLFELVWLEELVLGNRYRNGENWFGPRNFRLKNTICNIPYSLKKLKNLKKLVLSHLNLEPYSILRLSELNLNHLTWLELTENLIGSKGSLAISKMTHLNKLGLSFNEIGDRGAKAISKMTNLTSLDLRKNQIGDQGAVAIFELTSLNWLDLSTNKIEDQGIGPTSHMTNLFFLDLGFNQIGDIVAAAISKITNLNMLNLGYNQIGDIGAAAIANINNLTSLDLCNNKIGDEGAIVISKLVNITSLDLGYNQIRDRGAAALSSMPKLHTLDLGSNLISDIGATTISMIKNLTTLNLDFNKIGDQGATAISRMANVTSLDLMLNQIGDQGAFSISKMANLTSLNLRDNQIGSQGALAISNMTNLTLLNLSKNHLGDEGVIAISKMTNLDSLNLGYNQIGDQGASAISSLNNLTSLELMYNQIGDQGANAISQMTNLHFLDLGNNQIGNQGATAISKMINLKDLNLYNNRISLIYTLSPLIQLNRLNVSTNPTRDTPDSVISDYNCLNDLQAWWKATKNPNDTTPNKWINVQISGNGTVGKSTLVEAIERGYCDQEIESTDGVWIKQLMLFDKERDPVQLTIWDFGGQEIYHHTHRMFLSDNSIQLLVFDFENESAAFNGKKVVDPKTGFAVENHDITYWMENCLNGRSYCKVLLIENKLDRFRNAGKSLRTKQNHTDIPIFSVSARTGENIGRFKDNLLETAKELRHFGMLMPKSWISVRQHFIDNLGEEKDSIKLITNQEFEVLCREYGVIPASIPSLLGYLHDCGLVYIHEELLIDTIITDLRWALDAIYKPLSRSGSFYLHLLDRYGKVAAREIFESFGNNYTPDQCWLFLDFMQSCGICFPHKAENFVERDPDIIYIFPAHLPEEPSQLIRHNWESINSSTEQEMNYTVKEFPISRVFAFLTEMGNKTDNRLIWKNGLVILQPGEAVWVEFSGKDKVKMIIKNDILLSPLFVAVEELIDKNFEITSESDQDWSDSSSYSYSGELQKELVLREQPQSKIPEIVVCYASEDIEVVKAIGIHLGTLEKEMRLRFSYDEKVLDGKRDWPGHLKHVFNRADGFIFLVSERSMNREVKWFIHEEEIPLIVQRNQKEEIPVYRIMIHDIDMDQSINNFLPIHRGRTLPARGNARATALSKFVKDIIKGKFLKDFEEQKPRA